MTVMGRMATQSWLLSLLSPVQKWKPVKSSGKGEGSHPQPRGFLHMPFFLTTAGNLVPKKLAVETGAGDTPHRATCASLAKEKAGAEREPGGASGMQAEEIGWLVQGLEVLRQGKEGEGGPGQKAPIVHSLGRGRRSPTAPPWAQLK